MHRALSVVLLASTACAGSHARRTAASAASATSAPAALTPAQIAEHGLPSVVTMRTAESLGTGFVVRSDGWIATNLHVVVGGPRVKVTLRDGRELDVVEVLAASAEHDLALVRIDARGLPTLKLGDSDRMRPGDPIVAIGNPLGLEDTVSDGLVSARRRLPQGFEILQVSAPIAPGSSGGPLFNDRGEVVGIATAVAQGGQNLNFGVPIRYLARMLAEPDPIPFAQFAELIARVREANEPPPRKSVPHFAPALLDGCSSGAQQLVVKMVAEAIEAGAPLYNHGKPAACYHVYDGAASDLARHLPASCVGPVRVLAAAQKHAASLGDAGAQAWALRDTFDGLLEVIVRLQPRPSGVARP